MKPGDFADAKGPRYEYLLRNNPYTNQGTMDDLFDQADRQIGAARPRGAAIKWYFAEKWAADYAREQLMKSKKDYSDIVIGYMPPR
jgi:hypothetical protein